MDNFDYSINPRPKKRLILPVVFIIIGILSIIIWQSIYPKIESKKQRNEAIIGLGFALSEKESPESTIVKEMAHRHYRLKGIVSDDGFFSIYEKQFNSYGLSILGNEINDTRVKLLKTGCFLDFVGYQDGSVDVVYGKVVGKKIINFDNRKINCYLVNSTGLFYNGMSLSKNTIVISLAGLATSGGINANRWYYDQYAYLMKNAVESTIIHELQHQADGVVYSNSYDRNYGAVAELRAMLKSVIGCTNKAYAAEYIVKMDDPIYEGLPHHDGAELLRVILDVNSLDNEIIVSSAELAFNQTNAIFEELKGQ